MIITTLSFVLILSFQEDYHDRRATLLVSIFLLIMALMYESGLHQASAIAPAVALVYFVKTILVRREKLKRGAESLNAVPEKRKNDDMDYSQKVKRLNEQSVTVRHHPRYQGVDENGEAYFLPIISEPVIVEYPPGCIEL